MSFHKGTQSVVQSPYPNDELDALIRWALRDSVAGEEPSPEVWHKIRAGLEQPKECSYLRRRRVLIAQLSWLVQLLILGIIILVVLGLSLSQGFDFSLDYEYAVHAERTPQPGSERAVLPLTDDDVLSGYYFFRMTRELTIFDYRLMP